MARHNVYIPPRRKKPKELFFETEEKRIQTVLKLIHNSKNISDYTIRRIMKFGPGVHERTMKLIRDNYQESVEWNKKTRMWKSIGESFQELPVSPEPEKPTKGPWKLGTTWQLLK